MCLRSKVYTDTRIRAYGRLTAAHTSALSYALADQHIHIEADTHSLGRSDPETLIAQVDSVFKHEVHGLTTLTVQLDVL